MTHLKPLKNLATLLRTQIYLRTIWIGRTQLETHPAPNIFSPILVELGSVEHWNGQIAESTRCEKSLTMTQHSPGPRMHFCLQDFSPLRTFKFGPTLATDRMDLKSCTWWQWPTFKRDIWCWPWTRQQFQETSVHFWASKAPGTRNTLKKCPFWDSVAKKKTYELSRLLLLTKLKKETSSWTFLGKGFLFKGFCFCIFQRNKWTWLKIQHLLRDLSVHVFFTNSVSGTPFRAIPTVSNHEEPGVQVPLNLFSRSLQLLGWTLNTERSRKLLVGTAVFKFSLVPSGSQKGFCCRIGLHEFFLGNVAVKPTMPNMRKTKE